MSAFDEVFDAAFDIDATAVPVTATPGNHGGGTMHYHVHKGGRYTRFLFWFVLLAGMLS